MAHLLHIDASIQGEGSVSRRYTAEAVAAWRAANPGGTVTHRDLAADPLPHFGSDANLARRTDPAEHTPQQAAAWALATELVEEVLAADEIVLGAPLYNYGPATTLKSWVDHLIAPGLSRDPVTSEGLLGGRRVTVISSRGGGYGPGTPREGWNHLDAWLVNVLSTVGLDAQLIEIELTLADVVPAMADLRGLAVENRERASATIAERYALA